MLTNRSLIALACLAGLSGCIAKTAVGVVTAPVRVAGAGVDAVTTSQSESDERRGREARKRDERLGKLQRDYERATARCQRGEENACEDARNQYAEIQNLRLSRY